MPEIRSAAILSDVHYACAAEKARGNVELQIAPSPLARWFIHFYRSTLWRRDTYAHNYLLDRFIDAAGSPDLVVANGDYSCDTRFIGVADDAALASAQECLGRLQARFGEKLRSVIGDHELGKTSLLGGQGGLRLASWHRTRDTLSIQPFWELEIGRHLLLGVTSTLIGLPVFLYDTLDEERAEWEQLRAGHMEQIRAAFRRLSSHQRVILFCHDPTALAFLWQEPEIQSRFNQIERTVIGHLHSNLFLWKSRMLSGMPPIRFMGNSVQRMSEALSKGRSWRPFRVILCPALAGIELLKDGGFLRMDFEGENVSFSSHHLPWERARA